MQYSANQAADVTGKNVATITRAIKSGKISATKDASGAWQIDGAELSRVFPLRVQSLQSPETQSDAKPLQRLEDNALREELAALRERDKLKDMILEHHVAQLADLKEDRDRWRQQANALIADQRAILETKPEPVPKLLTPPRRWWPWGTFFRK